MRIKLPKLPNDPLKGAAFHEKLEKNKKVPMKVTRADKMKLKYGRNYQGGHGGGTR
jgi:ATP-dependent RNA helicase RhlE